MARAFVGQSGGEKKRVVVLWTMRLDSFYRTFLGMWTHGQYTNTNRKRKRKIPLSVSKEFFFRIWGKAARGIFRFPIALRTKANSEVSELAKKCIRVCLPAWDWHIFGVKNIHAKYTYVAENTQVCVKIEWVVSLVLSFFSLKKIPTVPYSSNDLRFDRTFCFESKSLFFFLFPYGSFSCEHILAWGLYNKFTNIKC